ncbi:MAG: hypothetical protein PHT12_01725 [Patescibacteria group bacterium]|nr:hypothetical protein [Patescibacteria group bacterium]
MVDRIQKAIRKMSAKEVVSVARIIEAVEAGHLAGLDIKKLHGSDDVYRVRHGELRIIFLRKADGWRVLAIERRSDTTYREW